MKAGSKNVLRIKNHVSKGDLGSVFMVMGRSLRDIHFLG